MLCDPDKPNKNRDKQLSGISLEDVVQKRRLDQPLTAKEFAVLAGISYTTARTWFQSPGFPLTFGRVFWSDFVTFRKRQQTYVLAPLECDKSFSSELNAPRLSEKAARILQEA